MVLQTPAHTPYRPKPSAAGSEPWSEQPAWGLPPRIAPAAAPRIAERRATYAASPAALSSPAAQTVRLSPGLAQLLNACLMDDAFCRAFLASPVGAASRAVQVPGTTFGCTLPDPALQLPALVLDDADLALLRRLPRASSLAAMAASLRTMVDHAGAVGDPQLDHAMAA